LAYLTWGTWWSAFWFLVYGNIYGHFQIHYGMRQVTKLLSNQNLLNEFFYYISSSYLANFEPLRWRHTHFVHHGNTYSTENPFDHEIEYGNNLKDTPKGFNYEV
jgi:fatty acid desaturase